MLDIIMSKQVNHTIYPENREKNKLTDKANGVLHAFTVLIIIDLFEISEH